MQNSDKPDLYQGKPLNIENKNNKNSKNTKK